MTPLLISALAFVCVATLIGALALVLNDNGSKSETRLDTLTGRRRRDDETMSILKKAAMERDKRSLFEMLTPNIPSLQKIIVQADANIRPSTLFGIGVGLACLGITGSWLAGVPWFFWPLIALIALAIPFTWLLNKRRLRLKKFAAQLSDALELVARALRAGHSLAAGLHVVAEEMPSPIADEFGRVYEEQNLGITIEDALKSMCERVPNLDLRFFVTSVMIQRQTGGDLAEILDKIGYVVRERYRIMGQVKALTAEGRLSGVILISLPFGLFLVMLYIKADYIAKLWSHPLGIKMAVAALVMQLLGAIVIKKIVSIKV